ncbi:MAG: maleylpyruvate isomerase family mycothiol-dependent enzyme [Ilumatobacteraceae bacterium]
MEKPDFLAALARDGEAFAAACEAADMSATVAACPGWSVADLAWHINEVLAFWATIVGQQRDSWEGYERPARSADDELVAAVRAQLAATLSILGAVDPAQPNWTWAADHSAGFVIRRLAHEMAVHRRDAEQAAGRDTVIDAALASDGIDEFLTYFRGDVAEGALPVGGSVHLHCTDVAGEWTVRPLPAGSDAVVREHAKGDAAIRGAASDILLVLWRRRPLNAVDVVGDPAVAERFVARPALD